MLTNQPFSLTTALIRTLFSPVVIRVMVFASLCVGSLFLHCGREEGVTKHPLPPHRLCEEHTVCHTVRSVTQVSVQTSLVSAVVEVTELAFQMLVL